MVAGLIFHTVLFTWQAYKQTDDQYLVFVHKYRKANRKCKVLYDLHDSTISYWLNEARIAKVQLHLVRHTSHLRNNTELFDMYELERYV